jgi:hypothetical protein
VNQTNHFFDLGYGWLCKHCSAADAEAKHLPSSTGKGFFRSSDTEKQPAELSGLPLATWSDLSRRALACPRCGIHETVTNR